MRIFLIVLLLASMAAAPLSAEDASVTVNNFYDGLAKVIERNMKSPDKCLVEVDRYYIENIASVEKIRALAEKNMAVAMSAKDRSAAVTDLEPAALEMMPIEAGITAPDLTRGSARYAQALENFTKKHPRRGEEIAARSIELLPGSELFMKKPE